MVNGQRTFSCDKILIFSVLVILNLVLSHSDTSSYRNMKVRDKDPVRHSTTPYNISLNLIENDQISRKGKNKSLGKIRKRVKEKKSRSYYPVKDSHSNLEVFTNNSSNSKEEDIKNQTNVLESDAKSSENESMENFTPISLSLEYVDLKRDKTGNRSKAAIDDPLDESADDNDNTATRSDDFSRKLPSPDHSTVRGLDKIIAARTSSRTLFPTDRRTYSVSSPTTSPASARSTPHPTSYFTATTPEFNHISFLTHPSKLSTSVRENNRKSFNDGHFQTNFAQRVVNAVGEVILGGKEDTRTSRIPENGFHSFFKMGSPISTSSPTISPFTTTTQKTTFKPKIEVFEEKDFHVNTFHTEV